MAFTVKSLFLSNSPEKEYGKSRLTGTVFDSIHLKYVHCRNYFRCSPQLTCSSITFWSNNHVEDSRSNGISVLLGDDFHRRCTCTYHAIQLPSLISQVSQLMRSRSDFSDHEAWGPEASASSIPSRLNIAQAQVWVFVDPIIILPLWGER